MRFSGAGIDAKLVVNGDRGWVISPQGKTDFPPSRMAALQETLETFQPVKFARTYAQRKVTGTEKIGDRSYTVVESNAPKRSERLYFDTQTGLLYKVHVDRRTLLGPVPNDLIFEDYRDVDGVKMPYTLMVSSISDRAVYKFSEIQINVAVDASPFEASPAK
jgi:hypothetical protein